MNKVFDAIEFAKSSMKTPHDISNRVTGSFIVGYDFSEGLDTGVLIIGEQKKGVVNVINAYQGEEAVDLYRRLLNK